MRSDELATRLAALHIAAFGWARACCRGDADLADEVLQVSYVKVLDSRATFRGRSSLKTWWFGVIRHTAAEQRRRRWRPTGASVLSSPPPDVDLLRAEQDAALRRALNRLSSRQRETLHLVFYEELTVDQAADVLGISAGAARVHYARGKQRLKQQLDEQAAP